MRHHQIDFDALNSRDRYKILASTIVPRPIALVTTLSADGSVNAAPYSFFNVLSADPPIVALGLENNEDGSPKDTAHNIRFSEEFTINLVSADIAPHMDICARPFERGVEELVEAGLQSKPGVRVRSPYIAESPIAFECKRYVALTISRSREIVLGQVLYAHIRDGIFDAARVRVDMDAINLIGRLAGPWYCSIDNRFKLASAHDEGASGADSPHRADTRIEAP